MTNEGIDDRHIRVFISSTFQDMEQEREQLIKKVFPILRRKAAERGVIVAELDLRWGITKEESENGKVLEICLNEIDRSRPFFIGLLGDRYGWCPSEDELKKNHSIEELHPWVRQAIKEGKSVTEMEFLYGALSPTLFRDKHIDAYFWIKKSDVTDDKRLENLKQTVRSNINYPCNDYATPEDLGEQVTAAFVKILEERYPPQRLSEVETFKLDQQFYRRRLNDLYIPIQENLYNLDRFLDDDNNRVMVLTGEPGSGKSATVSNWLQTRREDTFHRYISCFLQASNKGADINSVLDYLNSELLTILEREQEDELLGNNGNAEEEFKTLLANASTHNSIVLVIDGVNVLDDNDAKLLNWLPLAQNGCKVIITTIDTDSTYYFATRKGFEVVKVVPMVEGETRRLFIDKYLGRYGKTLADAQSDKLITSSISIVPGNLRAILNELKSNGNFDELDQSIEKFSIISSNKDLYRHILVEAEKTFGGDFVASILLPIAVSRNGLDETTIMAIAEATPLQWSQFYSYFEDYLISHQGLISIQNGAFQDTIFRLYGELDSDNIKVARCKIILNIDKDSEYESVYGYLETLFQYWKLKEYKQLNKLLSSSYGLIYPIDYDEGKLIKYWKELRDEKLPMWRYYLNLSNLDCGDYVRMGSFVSKVGQLHLCSHYCLQELIRNKFRITGNNEEKRSRKLTSNMLALTYLGDVFFKLKKYRFSKIISKKLLSLASSYPEEQLSKYFFNLAGMTIANCDLLLGNNNQAKTFFDETLNNDSNIDNIYDTESKAAILSNAVFTYLNTDKNKSIECFSEADLIYDSLDSDNPTYINGHILLLLQSGILFQDDLQQKRYYLQKAKELSDSAKQAGYYLQNSTLAGLYSSLASIVATEDKKTAEEYCDMVLNNYSISEDDKDRISSALLSCIDVYLYLHDIEKAKIAMNKLLNLPPSFSDYDAPGYDHSAMFHFYLGIIFMDEDPKLSEQSLQISINLLQELCKSSPLYQYYGAANDNLGRLLYMKGDYTAAIEKFKLAISVYKQLLSKYDLNILCSLIDATNQYGYSLLGTKEIATAKGVIKRNLRRLDKVPKADDRYYQLLISASVAMANILLKNDEDQEALTYMSKAIEAAEEGGLDQTVVESLKNDYYRLSSNDNTDET